MDAHTHRSFQDPYYTTGAYHEQSSGDADASFKVSHLIRLLRGYSECEQLRLRRVADVGCGTGATTLEMADKLRAFGVERVEGYDLHPGMEELAGSEDVAFHRDDFSSLEVTIYDLVVLFDVIEHVADPLEFLRRVGDRSRMVALHIPLDSCILNGIRGEWRTKINHPGHLVCFDIPAALTAVAMGGLRSVDYITTPVFRAPSGRATRNQRLLSPIRSALYAMSPYLLQATLGGVGLMLLAKSPGGTVAAG